MSGIGKCEVLPRGLGLGQGGQSLVKSKLMTPGEKNIGL